jgi:hypothetical protein
MDREEQSIARLRQAVQQTKATYQLAKEQFELTKDLEIEQPDGGFAKAQALRRERQALHDFRIAVHQFNRLILDGKLPVCWFSVKWKAVALS